MSYVRYYWALESDEPFSVLTFPIGCPQIIFHKKTPLYIPELHNSQSQFIKLFKNTYFASAKCRCINK